MTSSVRSNARNASACGMMEGAFFVGRTELLSWVNNLLDCNLQKVEQCASGAVYCQILDSCKPGSVAMKKVNWSAKMDHEFIPNYKVLQAAFDRNGIDKHIEVDRLIRAKYQDNLEFLQWMKCLWDREGGAHLDYDPSQAREGKPLPPWAKGDGRKVVPGGAPRIGEKENTRPAAVTEAKRPASGGYGAAGGPGPGTPASKTAAAVAGARVAAVREPARSTASSIDASQSAALQRENDELRAQMAAQHEEMEDLRLTLDGLEKERDYYFRKLRTVEVLCTGLEATPDESMTVDKMTKDVLDILYADGDDEEDVDAAGDNPGA
eukprot:TRINITY_DN1897_c0_g2_i1.p1 TRINITY_DN1897_c0_g2~~TRINITY_DN1897_c0_g2_i1.p1  ORF type:complete len:322 (+),score=92.98 TRINITY_DN1897_c0_g2_i1:87-1052(+)